MHREMASMGPPWDAGERKVTVGVRTDTSISFFLAFFSLLCWRWLVAAALPAPAAPPRATGAPSAYEGAWAPEHAQAEQPGLFGLG